MHVDRPGTEVVAARQAPPSPGRSGPAAGRARRSTPASAPRARRAPPVAICGRSARAAARRRCVVHADAHDREQVAHDATSVICGHVVEHRACPRQQGRRHELQHRVLGPADGDRARQWPAGPHDDAFAPRQYARHPIAACPNWSHPVTRVVQSTVVDRTGLEAIARATQRRGRARSRAADGTFGCAERSVPRRIDGSVTFDGARPTRRSVVTEITDFTMALPCGACCSSLPVRRFAAAPTGGRAGPWWAPPATARPPGGHRARSALHRVGGRRLPRHVAHPDDRVRRRRVRGRQRRAGSDAGGRAASASCSPSCCAPWPTGGADVASADRRAVGGCLTAALGASAPNMVALGDHPDASSRAFTTALALLIAVMAAEEMPAGAGPTR